MKYATLLIGAIGFAALLNSPLVARADDLAPSTILSNPQSYDGKPVAVQGTVQNYTTRQTPRGGTVASYKVCDQQMRNQKLTNVIVISQ